MRWTIKALPEAEKVAKLQEQLKIDPVLSTLLVQRGIETFEAAKSFFRPSLEELYDPFLMKDMDLAVSRIETALASNERILVYGDYDVDGTTSVALMASYLQTRTAEVATYIPDRYDEGYGISYQGIDFAEDNGFTLIIALDCGIKAIDKINYAKGKQIDFIICDHHRPGAVIPEAVAVLDPKRNDCSYPFKDLCGCGVGFKLISALAAREGHQIHDLRPYLDLVAIAIGADIVPIVGENRILAHHGIEVINTRPRAGIKALLTEVKKPQLTITDVVFIIAPRINAAGRMQHGNHAVALLMETDYNQATHFALDVNQFNLDRREADQRITEEALEQIRGKEEEKRFTTVVYNQSWHKGVIGIVASRLTETYYRPTIVFTKSGDKLAASARSVKGFDVYDALDACSEYIEQFGGHKYAAGLTLLPEQYEAFKAKFEAVVEATIEPKLLTPELNIDMVIPLRAINQRFMRIVKQMAPFGPKNMQPVFMTTNLRDTGYAKCVGEDKTHLRLTAVQADSDKIVGIGFNMGDKFNLIHGRQLFDAAYTVDENYWNGEVSVQLKLKDIKA